MTREPDDDHPFHINIPDCEGTCIVEGFGICRDQFLNPLKVKKVNIGTTNNPKVSNIRYYSDDKTSGKSHIYCMSFNIHSI